MKKSLSDWKDLASKELKDRSVDDLNWETLEDPELLHYKVLLQVKILTILSS